MLTSATLIVRSRLCVSILCGLALTATLAFGQSARTGTKKPAKSSKPQQQHSAQVQSKRKEQVPARPKLSPQKQFVVDVVHSAVALPQSDLQDRLRVLTAAVNIIGPVDAKAAKKYAVEGARIESELIAGGQTPVVSVLSAGHFDCTEAAAFVERIPATAAVQAEQSLINIMSACPKQGTDAVRQKLDLALNEGTLAARGLLALMERSGPKSPWSQSAFARMFRSLPSDPEKERAEAPNYAAMFNRMAPEVDKDVSKDAGLYFLEWLGKLSDGSEKDLALNITVDTLKQVLGEEGYQKALSSNVVARDVASRSGQPTEVEHTEEENVSVLAAMNQRGQDRTDELSKMPSTLRAREAAASGYAAGIAGDPATANRYFDIAFSALDEVWNNREEQKDAPSIVQEVSEAAAQVNAVAALRRTQGLSDASAQAIGMLAVARVVLGQDNVPDPISTATTPGRSAGSRGHPVR